MKSYIYTLILLIALTGCSKKVDNTSPQTAITTTIGFDIKDQNVKVSLNSTTLTMNYVENIALLVKADEFQSSWSIIFNQDFSLSQLAKFNFTTVTKAGVTVTNYLESNLNNITITSKTDTVINSIHFIKTSFSRSILFTNTYATQAMPITNMLICWLQRMLLVSRRTLHRLTVTRQPPLHKMF